ncbi:hypothetical protein Pcinc_032217 [Petrolisthes cinctipes]|uniref:Uncharacterized protein n=1 Tax=Petrolisthes cinctipes TaxID=88211 RepID=A0AAE1K3P9_PETCI|nr:hypothetical protein Pcinc_032217 [Petrolisthes cinctipes]
MKRASRLAQVRVRWGTGRGWDEGQSRDPSSSAYTLQAHDKRTLAQYCSSTSYLVFFYAREHHHVEFNMPLTA